MHKPFHLLMSLALLVSVLSVMNSSSELAIAQESSKPTNEYLRKLKDAREKQNQAQLEMSKTQKLTPKQRQANDQLKYYDYQIANAEDIIEQGGTFGETEFLAAMDAIRADMQEGFQRSLADNKAEYESKRAEADRKLAESSKAIMEKRNKAIKESDEKYGRVISSADLLYKFRVNLGGVYLAIWNLPVDRSFHSRLTSSITVQLFNGSELVWKSKSLKLSNKEARNVMQLPNVMFDSVRIDLTKWNGTGCGLAEVEVFIGDDNVALHRPCEVSGMETLPIHLDDQHAVTDGIREPKEEGKGYWIPEEKAKAYVVIDLAGEKVAPPEPELVVPE